MALMSLMPIPRVTGDKIKIAPEEESSFGIVFVDVAGAEHLVTRKPTENLPIFQFKDTGTGTPRHNLRFAPYREVKGINAARRLVTSRQDVGLR
jgi:hypothetical protein